MKKYLSLCLLALTFTSAAYAAQVVARGEQARQMYNQMQAPVQITDYDTQGRECRKTVDNVYCSFMCNYARDGGVFAPAGEQVICIAY